MQNPFNDKLTKPFQRNVYNSVKGQIRLGVLKQDMLENIPGLDAGGMKILDAGGGMGQMSRELASLGHMVTLCEPSEEMLAVAEEENLKAGLQIELLPCSIGELPSRLEGTFDLVLFHGVIAWLKEPFEALKVLAGYMKPGSILSLLYYNLNRLILKCGAGAQLSQIETGRYIPKKRAAPLTPVNPLTLEDVSPWLTELKLDILSRAGIRIFYDLMRNPHEFEGKETKLLEIELFYKSKEPFASLGQHTHLVCRKKN